MGASLTQQVGKLVDDAIGGDIVVDLTYFGDADNSIRDPLIQLAQLVLGRVPPDIQLPTE